MKRKEVGELRLGLYYRSEYFSICKLRYGNRNKNKYGEAVDHIWENLVA